MNRPLVLLAVAFLALIFLAAFPAQAQYGYRSYSYDNAGIAGAVRNHYWWVGGATPRYYYVVPADDYGYEPYYRSYWRSNYYRGW